MDYNLKTLESLKKEIKTVLTLVSQREKILNTNEGLICIKIHPMTLDYEVSIESYLMDSSGLQTNWFGKSLKTALQKALKGVEYWHSFEKDAVPYQFQENYYC